MPWMWEPGHMWGLWGLMLMPFMMVLVWLPLLLLCAWGARMLFGSGHSATPSLPPALGLEPDAHELARRAYARGDISREQFLQIVEDLDHTKGTRNDAAAS